MNDNLYRLIPSVDKLLSYSLSQQELNKLPKKWLSEQIGFFLDSYREKITQENITATELEFSSLCAKLSIFLLKKNSPQLKQVINATGVVLHTNMGRALLAKEAQIAVASICSNYSNLEFNLETGMRGSRYDHVEELLCSITGAEAAIVVNNNAAAVLLILDSFAKAKEVIVSRGQLVEIGGSFRIPDIMEKSGARLKEIGTTNRTHLKDYQNAITDDTVALLRVHTSNFRIIGFTHEEPLEALVALAKEKNIMLIEDLGSGSLDGFETLTLLHEPTVQKSIQAGVDIVSFSGDKVLGGPQAGVIVGKKEYIDTLKKNPLTRALRIDKLTLVALEATLRLYRDKDLAREKIPTLAMLYISKEDLAKKAQELFSLINNKNQTLTITLKDGFSKVGGGAFPEQNLATTLIIISSSKENAQNLKTKLRENTMPIIARIEDDFLCLDVRTIAKEDFNLILLALEKL